MNNLKDIKANVVVEIDAADFSNVEIRTPGFAGSNKFGFGWTSPEEFARRVDSGPILSGPYLYGFGLSTCLHNGPIEARRPVIFVRTGSVIAVRNLVKRGHLRTFYFEATVSNGGYVDFEYVGGTDSKFAKKTTLNLEVKEISKDEYFTYLQNRG